MTVDSGQRGADSRPQLLTGQSGEMLLDIDNNVVDGFPLRWEQKGLPGEAATNHKCNALQQQQQRWPVP